MKCQIKGRELLRKILWSDAVLGGTTALAGLLFYNSLTTMLGLTTRFITVVSAVTLLYAVVAVRLATQKNMSVSLLRGLIGANWLWTLVSVVLFLIYYRAATGLGLSFLVAQTIVVGGLAYWEGNHTFLTKQMIRSASLKPTLA